MIADTHIGDGVVLAVWQESEIVFVAIPPVIAVDARDVGAGYGKLPATAFADILTVRYAVKDPSAVHAGGRGAALRYSAIAIC